MMKDYGESIILYIGMIAFAMITSIAFSSFMEKPVIKILNNIIFTKKNKTEKILA